MPKAAEAISDKESWDAVQAYVSAVGTVAHDWNRLHEELGKLFVITLRARSHKIAAAIWYAPYSDRLQRDLLMAVIDACDIRLFEKFPPSAKADLIDFMRKINSLSTKRDDVVHGPVLFDDETGRPQIIADYLTDHRRAKALARRVRLPASLYRCAGELRL